MRKPRAHFGRVSRALVIVCAMAVLLGLGLGMVYWYDNRPDYFSTSTILTSPPSGQSGVAATDLTRILDAADAALARQGLSVSRSGQTHLNARTPSAERTIGTQWTISVSLDKHRPAENLEFEFVRTRLEVTGRFVPAMAEQPFALLPVVAVQGEQFRSLVIQSLTPAPTNH